MFGTAPTPFDVRLVAFRIPVRIHPSFWIAGVLMGQGLWEHPDVLFLFVISLFVSVFVHELGHALMSEAFGWESEILLYWCGGLAYSNRSHNRTPWREIAVSLAGPFAGFGLFGLTLLVMYLFRHQRLDERVYDVISFLIQINLFWGFVNLLPVLPLDGGQVCRSFLTWCGLRDPMRTACMISVPFAALAAGFFFYMANNSLGGMLFAMLCLQNVVALQSDQ